MASYSLEKVVWGDADFERMGWHDVGVWSMHAAPETFEFVLDLDYIFQWVPPAAGQTTFSFWVSPVTMVFANVGDVRVDLESGQGAVEIDGLHREHPRLTPNGRFTEHRYRFDCQEGEISFWATGFELFVRRAPVLSERRWLRLADRGGVGFGRGLEPA